MINLCNELPTIQLGSGVVALESLWLEQTLAVAAQAAGYTHWLPAEHIARTVTAYLLADSSRDPVSLERFALTVRGVLEGIGYGEVAPFFLRGGIEVGVSFLDLVEKVEPGFELGFFKECEVALGRLLACEVVGKVFFQDTVPAIKKFLRRAHWCSECDQFRDEVVGFIRHEMVRRTGRQDFSFSIR